MAPNETHNKNPSNPFRSTNERLEFPPNPQHVGSGTFHYPPYPFNQGYPPNQGYNQMYPSSAMNQGYVPPMPFNQMHPPNQGYPPNATNKMYPPNFKKPSLKPNHFVLKPNPSLHPSFTKPNLHQNASKKVPPTAGTAESTSAEDEEEEEFEETPITSEEEEEEEEDVSRDATKRINEGKKAAIAGKHGVTIKAMLDRTDAIIMKELELQLAKEENNKKELEVQLAKEETKRFLQRNQLLKTLLGKAKLTPAEEAAKEVLLKMLCR